MDITVIAVTHKTVVLFDSPFGECVGVWSEGTPETGEYSVELDLSEVEDSNEIQPAAACRPSLCYKDDYICVTGLLVDYEEDGFCTLRLGENELCVESPYDARVEGLVGAYVTLRVGCLYISAAER